MSNSSIKELAKKRLSENRWPMVLVALIIMAVGALVTATTGIVVNVTTDAVNGAPNVTYTHSNPVLGITSFMINIFVLNVLSVGVFKFFRQNRYTNEESAVMFDSFKVNYGKNVLAMFLVTLFTSLGCILFLVPGVIVSLGLALVPYLLTERPDLDVMDTIKLSWTLMKGYKWRYFLFILSYIGWLFLDALTLGLLGIFYVHPYMYQAQAIFCDEVLNRMMIKGEDL